MSKRDFFTGKYPVKLFTKAFLIYPRNLGQLLLHLLSHVFRAGRGLSDFVRGVLIHHEHRNSIQSTSLELRVPPPEEKR
jgi:hypothetical protein